MTEDLTTITPEAIKTTPAIVQTLRMSTSPPLARDRLVGLADSSKNLVETLEQGKIPPQISRALLDEHLVRIVAIITRLLDVDIFPWLVPDPATQLRRRPSEEEMPPQLRFAKKTS